ncbi:S-layer homology domain-containing protein [Bacillus smithii]|uniref:S-layer homology domain-containing protein n=1 Tax=Bacillus smithii TaxID=1479 RepID=UPI003D219F46
MAYQPKSYRKFAATAATATLVATAVTPAFAAENLPFGDVNQNYAEAVGALYSKGIVNGVSKTEFGTYQSLKRGDAAVIIARALELDTKNAPDAGFKDVNSNIKGAVNALVAKGIISGVSKDKFDPNSPLTRGQMAKILVNAYPSLKDEAKETPFTDLTAGFKPYIEALYGAGIAGGTSKTTYGTNQNITRGDFAKLLYKAMNFEAPKAESIKAIDDITVDEGTKLEDVKLPEKVTVVYSDKSEKEASVKWDTSKLDLSKPDTYKLEGTVDGTDLKASVNVVVKAVAPKVESVSAINGKTIQIKFNKAIDASTVLDDKGTTDTSDDTLKTTSIKLTELDDQTAVTQANIKASLSEDKKTLTLVASGSEFFTKRYVVDIKNVKTTDGQDVPAYTTTIDATDSVRPTVQSSSYEDNGQTLKVKFSEPLASVGTVKLYDGTTEIPVSPSLNSNGDELTISLASSSVPVNKDLTLKIFGAVDYNGNVINPNPAELTVKKTTVDTTKPTVQKVEVVNNKTVKVTFSEKLSANPTIKIGGTAAAISSVDSTGLVYTATLASGLTGLQSVEVSNYSDLAGNDGDTYTKVVELKADTTAPKLVSSQVVKVNGIEKLVLTFDEEVAPQSGVTFIAATDKYVDDNNVQKTVGSALTTSASNFALYNPVNGASKSVALDISSLPKGKYTVSLPANLVEDLSSNSYSEGKQITFVRGTDSLTTKPTLDNTVDTNGVEVVDNDTLRFTFTQNLDASALNLSNFNINGLALSKAVFDGDTKHILVTIAPGANTWTGTHTITVSNIKNASGLVMDTVTTTENMKENVAPTFTAKLVAPDVIKVDFSEPVANSDITNALSGSNFTVKVDGTENTVDGVYTDSAASTSVSGNTGYKTVYLKLHDQVSDLTKPITVSATDIVDVDQTGSIVASDVVGNAVSKDTVNVSN